MKFTKNSSSAIAIFLFTSASLQAEITISGQSNTYSSNDLDWLSHTTLDIDSNGLGTDGFFFFGDYRNNGRRSGQPFSVNVSSLPSYVSNVSQGAQFSLVAEGFNGYASIDSPLSLDGVNRISGFALSTNGNAGANNEILTFTVSSLPSGTTARVGIFAGVEASGDGRWDPTSITLSDGFSTASVGNHSTDPLPATPGWAFFDIDSNGTYSVLTTKRFDSQGSGITGLTFDSIGSGGSASVVFPHIGEAHLINLQDDQGTYGDFVSTIVRQLRVDSGSYTPEAVIPIGAYAPGTIHRLVVNSSNTDTSSLIEFAVTEENEIELIQYHQAGAEKIETVIAGDGSIANSKELALLLPNADVGEVTVTHCSSDEEYWADSQYEMSHFNFNQYTPEYLQPTTPNSGPKGDLSMGIYGDQN